MLLLTARLRLLHGKPHNRRSINKSRQRRTSNLTKQRRNRSNMTSARDTEQIRITRVVEEHHTSSKAHRSLFVWITLMVVLTLCGRSRSYEGQNTGDKSVALRIIAPESSVCSGTSSLKVDIYLTN